MTWNAYYTGSGAERDVALPAPPPWRAFPQRRPMGGLFQTSGPLIEAVNAALVLRRPLLLTGAPGSGKSSLIESVAAELGLGPVLRWHITSRSTLSDALYRYDVLGRIHAQQFAKAVGRPVQDNIADFLELGPLGAALAPSSRPRALLIDEIDKSDIDLPSDLLDVLERGEFEIPELIRHQDQSVQIRERGGSLEHTISKGRVSCTEFPFIVMTSNGERGFPPAFLRRCVRFDMPPLDEDTLTRIVTAHLGAPTSARVAQEISTFARRVNAGDPLATDQLLNAVFLLTSEVPPTAEDRDSLLKVLWKHLGDV